jgi:hypothetical protein
VLPFSDGDRFFRATFGMEASTYRQQPAVVRINCTAGACTTTDVETLLARYPGLTLWFDGDLALDTSPAGGSLGDTDNPVMLVVTGQLRVAADATINGFVYARDVRWTAPDAVLRGALVALQDFQATAPATLVYDADMLKTIQLFYGSFVRVPGGWNRPT